MDVTFSPALQETNSSANKPPDGFTQPNGLPAVPLVLGAAGHCDPRAEDAEALRQTLAELFRQFKSAYPHTPLVLLSSLAEGADQLAARVALDNDVFVRAPLPFPEEIYRQSTSFNTDAARTALDELLADPRVEAFVVPLPEGAAPPGVDWGAVAADRVEDKNRNVRRACYANAGGYIVRHCHALIALWDGKEGDPARPSGTAEYVAFKLQGKAPALYPWTDAEPLGFGGERGPVYAIHTPRANARPDDAPPGKPAGEAAILLPSKDKPCERLDPPEPLARPVRPGTRLRQWVAAWPGGRRGESDQARAELWQFQETCQAVDDFNRDVLSTAGDAGLRKRLDAVEEGLPADLRSSGRPGRWLARLSAIREAAGHLSRRLQPTLDVTEFVVFALTGLSLVFFNFHGHFSTAEFQAFYRYIWLGLFLVIFLAVLVIVQVVRRRRLHERRLDYRALAEALRVRRAWALAGVGASVADSYLGQLRGEMSWARRALQHVCPPSPVWAEQFALLDGDKQLRRLEMVEKDWVKGQIAQFEKAHRREKRWAVWLRVVGFPLALLGLLLPLVALCAAPSEPLRWLLAADFFVIAGGLCLAFCEHRSHEELANQYERPRVVFESGRNELERRLAGKDVPGAQAVLQALGREAIAEHAQWLILRRARPVEVHIG